MAVEQKQNLTSRLKEAWSHADSQSMLTIIKLCKSGYLIKAMQGNRQMVRVCEWHEFEQAIDNRLVYEIDRCVSELSEDLERRKASAGVDARKKDAKGDSMEGLDAC